MRSRAVLTHRFRLGYWQTWNVGPVGVARHQANPERHQCQQIRTRSSDSPHLYASSPPRLKLLSARLWLMRLFGAVSALGCNLPEDDLRDLVASVITPSLSV